MITVSSCGVKLQEVLSGLEKKVDIHMHFCGFSLNIHHFIIFFLYTWGVTWGVMITSYSVNRNCN